MLKAFFRSMLSMMVCCQLRQTMRKGRKMVTRVVAIVALSIFLAIGTVGCFALSAEEQAQAAFARAEAENAKGNFDQAIAEYSKAIELDPKYPHS